MGRMWKTVGAGLVAAFALALPADALDVRETTSPGGVTFWMVEEQSIPIVSINIDFVGGGRLDPADKIGVGRMMVGLLDEGAGDMDTVAFAKARDALSARYSFSLNREQVSVSAQMLADDAKASAALLGAALSAPRFDADAIERIRGQLLSTIASSETDPNDIAGKAWNARAFPDHPYGRPLDGTADTVSALAREDMVAAYDRMISRSKAVVAVVGAVTEAEAGRLVDLVLADVPEGTPAPAVAPTAPPPPGMEVIPLPVPQSVAVFGHAGMERDHPDFFAAFVMNYILGGGGFSSRLTEEVRVKRGLAYGVYSYFSLREGAPLYLGGTQTANERMNESIEVIRAEWERMRTEGVTAEELEAAKRYLTGAFPLRFDSNSRISAYLVFLQRENLGIDYLDRRNGLVEAVTLEDVGRVAGQLLDPDALSIVVVGEPAGL